MAITVEGNTGMSETWIFEPHAMYGAVDPDDGEPFPFGYISSDRLMPIFELRPVLVYTPAELAARARLMSAAPDLLAALKDARPAIVGLAERLDGEAASPLLRQIDAALSQAES